MKTAIAADCRLQDVAMPILEVDHLAAPLPFISRNRASASQKHAELMGYNTPRGEAIRTSVILNAEDYWRKRASIERLPGTGSASVGDLAEALAQLGEIDEAIALLERRFAARGYHIMYLKGNNVSER